MTKLSIKLIKFYQVYLRQVVVIVSPFPSGCRFYPSCSEYTIEAIHKEGWLRGSCKGIIRILKCNPFLSKI